MNTFAHQMGKTAAGELETNPNDQTYAHGGMLLGAGSGALMNWLTTPEGMHWAKRVVPGLLAGGAVGGSLGHLTDAGIHAQYVRDKVNNGQWGAIQDLTERVVPLEERRNW